VHAIQALGAVVAEVAGASLHRVSQLVPASALGTPAPPSALGTPFGGPHDMGNRQGFHCSTRSGFSHRQNSSTAFVTLRSFQAACIACQVVMDEDALAGLELVVKPAPEPRDIVWQNAAKSHGQRFVRQFFVEVALLFGLAFWSVPVSLLQAWCSVARSQNLVGFQLPPGFAHSRFYSLVTLYLPVLALLLLLEVLPALLYQLARCYEGMKSRSSTHLLTMRRYWRFQLATIFVAVLSGSISDSLKSILEQPASILWQLGQSLPKVAFATST
jgi:hypothetical protein